MIVDELRSAIQEAIWKQGIPQAELARRIEMSPAQVSRFLTGERGLSLEAIEKLMDVLELEMVIRPRRKRKDC